MKFYLSIFISLLLVCNGFSQANMALDASHLVDIREGEIFKSKLDLQDIFAHDEQHIYAKQVKISTLGGIKYYITKFDSKTLEVTSEVELNLEENGSDMEYERVFMLNDQIHFFTSFANKSTKTNYLFHQTINPKTLKQNGDIEKVGSMDFEKNKDLKTSGYTIELSQDSSKIMVAYALPYEKDGNEKFGVTVYDDKMNEIWSDERSIPYADKLFSINDFDVTNNGAFLVQGKLWKEKSERERKEVNYKYLIIEYNEGGDKGVEYEINLDGKFVQSVIMRPSVDGKILMGGFYKEQTKSTQGGSFFLIVDRENKEILHKSYEPFEIDFITSDMKEKDAKKAKKKDDKGKDVGIGNLVLDNIRLREDGGFVMVGEQYWVTTRTYTDSNGNMRTTTTYNYWDIVVVSVSPNGEIDWNAKIPKRQSLGTNLYSSYVSSVVGSSLFFIFNDNPKNINYNGDGKLKYMTIKDPLIFLVEVDSDGKVFRRTLLKGGGKGSAIFPSASEQTADDTIILSSGRGKKKRLTEVKFKNTNR